MVYSPEIPFNDLPDLPPQLDAEVQMTLLTHAMQAARSLAELKGLCETMTEEALRNLLINTIVLQESRDSSAIENIVTTQDELYQAALDDSSSNSAAKEVLNYREAISTGIRLIENNHNLITTNLLANVVQVIKHNQSGIRTQAGTALKNAIKGDIIYTPPCCEDVIRGKLAKLEVFINLDDKSTLDPIIKLAMVHYQFESIHPFSDGNGRTGRILNMLYFVQQQLLPQPVLYLSSYIIEHKQEYYRLLREVTEKGNWLDWILFMTTAVNTTAQLTMFKIRGILKLKSDLEPKIMQVLDKFGNRNALFDLMFTMPYLKINLLVDRGIAHRETASNYLKKLEDAGILRKVSVGKNNYYINYRLMDLLTQ